MSTEPHKPHRHAGAEPVHDTVAFEIRDIKARTIYWYLFALAVSVVLSYGICVFVLRLTTRIATQSDTPPPPVRQEMKDYQSMPPEPRLQTNPRDDLRDLRMHEDQVLTSYGWVDKNAGVVRIPIDEAMKIVVKQGLPVRQER